MTAKHTVTLVTASDLGGRYWTVHVDNGPVMPHTAEDATARAVAREWVRRLRQPWNQIVTEGWDGDAGCSVPMDAEFRGALPAPPVVEAARQAAQAALPARAKHSAAERDAALAALEAERGHTLASLRVEARRIAQQERRPVSTNDLRHMVEPLGITDARLLGQTFRTGEWEPTGDSIPGVSPRAHAGRTVLLWRLKPPG